MSEVIAIEGLSFAYPDGTEALRSVSLSVAPGERVALVGPNGAGKSTLLLHLNGLLHGAGRVTVCGIPVDDGRLEEVRLKVGLVFQDPDDQLFMPTVFDDVAFGPLNMDLDRPDVERRVAEALNKVDMSYAAERPSHHLSFGERKRVCVATVLAMSPEVLALDEPTTNLDPRHRRQLIELLAGFKLTMVVATHDLDAVLDLCDRVVLLDGGRVAADGPAERVLTDRELLSAHGLELPLSRQR
ncbi:MAG: cobalt ABC transporter ATP-binding protein [Planctomycetes bacterium SM23_32]|nr:MAG: cobalt ABC transporter ATP-binding protein [Planctomycetes bacterium SM23_32]